MSAMQRFTIGTGLVLAVLSGGSEASAQDKAGVRTVMGTCYISAGPDHDSPATTYFTPWQALPLFEINATERMQFVDYVANRYGTLGQKREDTICLLYTSDA